MVAPGHVVRAFYNVNPFVMRWNKSSYPSHHASHTHTYKYVYIYTETYAYIIILTRTVMEGVDIRVGIWTIIKNLRFFKTLNFHPPNFQFIQIIETRSRYVNFKFFLHYFQAPYSSVHFFIQFLYVTHYQFIFF